MNKIVRNKDIVSGNNDLVPLFSIENFPVFQGCVKHAKSEDLLENLDFYISESSGMVQLNPLLPLDVIYQSEHNPGGIGQTWLSHHKCFADFIHKLKPKKIFEIGGSHGILSENYYALDPQVDWTIIEPAPVPDLNLKAKLIKGFFDVHTEFDPDTDMVVHSHVLEHIYDPGKFFDNLDKLSNGTYMCFSIPNLLENIKDKHTNALSFEHTYFCTEEYVEYWLARSKFKILNKEYYNKHSIFYAVQKSNEVTAIGMPNLIATNKELFDQFWKYYHEEIAIINSVVSNWKHDVYLFGGHVFSQFLIATGLDISKINCILDNSPLKQGSRLYGTDFTVKSPKVITDNALIILRAGSYTEEIKTDILTNINSTITFI